MEKSNLVSLEVVCRVHTSLPSGVEGAAGLC